MRLLASENFPRAIVIALRQDGHDVAWILEDARGAADADVLARAQRETRIVATFDKDFGELAFRSGLPAACGVILFRIVGSPEAQVRLARDLLRDRADWVGHFATVTNEKVRQRPLPRVDERP